MKPTSNQFARVGKTRKSLQAKLFNINGILDRLDNSTKIVRIPKAK